MQYRHSFHAGNFADVHKHIALLQLIEAMHRKAKGFLYLETHAGEGLYDLHGPQARQGAESKTGFARLEQQLARTSGDVHPAIRGYADAVSRIRAALGPHCLPGSPLLAASALRDTDQAICVETRPQAARALQRVFERSPALLATSPRVVAGNGYHELKRALPPPSRRGLTLIDPPYEATDEHRQLAITLAAGLERFETGVFALWYPIKKQVDCDAWLARLVRDFSTAHAGGGNVPHDPGSRRGPERVGHADRQSALAVRQERRPVAACTSRAARRQLGQQGKMAGA